MVFGREQFMHMIDEANGLAVDVMHHGVALGGHEAFLGELEGAGQRVQECVGLKRTPVGWQFKPLKEVS